MLAKVLISAIAVMLAGCGKDPGSAIQLPRKQPVIIKDHHNNTPFIIDSTLLGDYPESIKLFYKNNKYNSLWNDEADRKTMLICIASSEEDGLNPKDYNYRELKKFEKKHRYLFQ